MALSKEDRAAQKRASRKARLARLAAGATPKAPKVDHRGAAADKAEAKRARDRAYQAKRRAAAKAAK